MQRFVSIFASNGMHAVNKRAHYNKFCLSFILFCLFFCAWCVPIFFIASSISLSPAEACIGHSISQFNDHNHWNDLSSCIWTPKTLWILIRYFYHYWVASKTLSNSSQIKVNFVSRKKSVAQVSDFHRSSNTRFIRLFGESAIIMK